MDTYRIRTFLVITLYLSMMAASFSLAEVVTTERLEIRPVTAQDYESYKKIMTNEKAQKNANGKNNASPGLFSELVRKTERVVSNTNEVANSMNNQVGFMVIDRASGKPIGVMNFWNHIPGDYWETNTMIFPGEGDSIENWNKGYGTEARKAMLPYLFDTLKLPGLVSAVSESNTPSQKVTEKLGFRYMGDASERPNAINKSEKFKEYRLSREAYKNEKPDVPKEPGVSVATQQSVAQVLSFDAPEISKVSTIYKVLMRDPFVRSRLSPEYIMVAANQIALQGKDPIDALKGQRAQLEKNGQTIEPLAMNTEPSSHISTDSSADPLERLAKQLTKKFEKDGVKTIKIEQNPMSMTPLFGVTVIFADGTKKGRSFTVHLGQDIGEILEKGLTDEIPNMKKPEIKPAPVEKSKTLAEILKEKIDVFAKAYDETPARLRMADKDGQACADFASLLSNTLGVDVKLVKIEKGEWSGSMSTVGEPKSVKYSLTHNGVTTEINLPYEVDMGMVTMDNEGYLRKALTNLASAAEAVIRTNETRLKPLIPSFFAANKSGSGLGGCSVLGIIGGSNAP